MTVIPGAIQQRHKTTWAVKPRAPMGIVTPDELRRIADAAADHAVEAVKITSGQRLILLGIPQDRLASLQEALGPMGQLCRNYVQACPGVAHCTHAAQDSLAMGRQLEALVFGREFPAKVKLGVSACPFCCAESQVRDIGLVGRRRGWHVYVGGNSGTKPRVADLLATDLQDADALDLVRRFLDHYAATCVGKVRVARFVQQQGLDAIHQALGLPALEPGFTPAKA
ncbi:MAG: NAD(P)/FAD-dependent oxidoreductase [Desulfovibrio sp.]|nr:NAD(P)/FAD-dependent oxidoreductase [Desulfovibrio sp.]